MEEESYHHQEMQSSSSSFQFQLSSDIHHVPPSLDLQLSISLKPPPEMRNMDVEALKWQAAEQIRLAAMEKAYAERLRELTRREMELAQTEFARARAMWERARDEVHRADRLKERAMDSPCNMEITCHSCRHKFTPSN